MRPSEVPAFEVSFWRGAVQPYCVVIPVINEGARLHRLLDRMVAANTAGCADVLIVDGGSTDGSVAREALERRNVCGLLIKTGPGRLSAQLRCAYSFALEHGYRGVITIDGNDKDDPEAIPRFVATLEQGLDFVQASRYAAGGTAQNTPWIRDLAVRWVHAPILSLASGFHWSDTTQGFRGYSRRLLCDPRVAIFRNVFQNYELLAYLSYRAPRLEYRCIEIPTARRYPSTGPTPTTIRGIGGQLALLGTLLRACLGRFNP